jgi:hypothetical protein
MKRVPGDKGVAPVLPVAGPINDSMRRLQIGIAGVLTVLLLVGMAGLIGERAQERALESVATDTSVELPGESTATGKAPLEELGVQPVSKDENEDTPVKVPQAAPSASTVPDLEPDPELQRARQSSQ